MRHKLIENAVKLRIQIDKDIAKRHVLYNSLDDKHEALRRITESFSKEEMTRYQERIK